MSEGFSGFKNLQELLLKYMEIGYDTGTVSSATDTTLTCEGKDWGTDIWKDLYVEIVEGTGKGQIRKIASNTKDTITVTSAWTTIPDTTSKFRIFGALDYTVLMDILSQLDIKLSEFRDALRGADTKDFSTLEADVESILGKLDIALSTLRDGIKDGVKLLDTGGVAINPAKEDGNLASILGQLDIKISELRDALINPLVDTLILNNATIDAAGESDVIEIKGAKHVDVLIYVGTPTGSPSVTFHLQVIEPTSGKVIRTYDGNTLSAEGADYIMVDGLMLGTHVKVTWDGTLDASNYFSGCFVRLVAKR